MNYNITTDLDIKPLMDETFQHIHKLKMTDDEKINLAGFYVLFIVESLENSKNTEQENNIVKDMYANMIVMAINIHKLTFKSNEI